ncbi:Endonuclease 8 1 [Clavibacter michiganensis subsp. michiganensis]|uniref:DNA-formamidopyrimidine glycosylase family protein n=1 Tax=Clavibacter michiganensis TaxID=28447 RepID=UPI000B6C8106|nr:Endonuclease 8 1 [Clavibacter michiganensis subsp. michiganensis]
MPEGHSIHRIAKQFEAHFVGDVVQASSPQGRFAEGAAVLDGRRLVAARAVGKQMFLEFDGDVWLRVHLGLYGAWDFAGDVSTLNRMGQNGMRGDVPVTTGSVTRPSTPTRRTRSRASARPAGRASAWPSRRRSTTRSRPRRGRQSPWARCAFGS